MRSGAGFRAVVCAGAALALLAPGAPVLPTTIDEVLSYGPLRAWLDVWEPILTATLVASTLVAALTAVHAFRRGHLIWAVVNLLIGITAPVYVLKHMDEVRWPFRVAGLLILLSPAAALIAMFCDLLAHPITF